MYKGLPFSTLTAPLFKLNFTFILILVLVTLTAGTLQYPYLFI